MDEHAEAVEADLAHYYQVDLLDVWRGAMDWRRLRVLIRGLPPEGTALARETHGVSGNWSTADWLLERAVNVISEGVWAYLEVNRDTTRNPRPTPRPTPVLLPRTPVAAEPDSAGGPRLTADGRRIATSRETFRILSGALN